MKIRDKVLIVEDEQSISNFISTVPASYNYDALIARTGAEALSMISSHCPDLFILDLGLPDMDGLEILQQLIQSAGDRCLCPLSRTGQGECSGFGSRRLSDQTLWHR